MNKALGKIRGFTLIELIVVIAVIGILATITIVGFGRYQADTRDARRVSSITVIAEALEKYYDQNGEYPNCSAVSAASSVVTKNTLIGIDPTVLVAPQSSDDNSIKCTSAGNVLTTGGADFFEYQGDGSDGCNTNGSCLGFTLKYKGESDGQIKTVASRRSASILTSGTISNLTATPFSFSQVNLAWGTISGAATYNIQWKINSNDFTSPTGSSTSSTTSTSITGLTIGTLYYFRVQPVALAGTTGNWSNIASATTYTIGTPVCTAAMGPIPMSQLQCSWSAVTNATSYNLDYANNPSFTGATSIVGATSPYVVSGLSPGTTLYFRVKAVAAGYTSGWSATASAITQLPVPVCTASTLNSNTQITVSWAASAGAITYNLQIATNAGFSPGGYVWNTASTSVTATGLSNGTTYYFRVQAVNGAVQSTWGACPSASTGVDGPTSVGWSADAYGVRNTASVGWMPGAYPGAGTYWTNGMNIYGTCQPGATVVVRLYQYYAYSNNTVQNTSHLQDWTWNNQDLYVVGGRSTWMVWWQGWVACQVGGTRAGDTYLGNAGPY